MGIHRRRDCTVDEERQRLRDVRWALADRRDHAQVRAPVVAVYAALFPDIRNGNPAHIVKNLDWEQKYINPFRAASME